VLPLGQLRVRTLSNSFGFAHSAEQGFKSEAVVKWFNKTKGFGFVEPSDGSSDAFLHMSVLARAGLDEISEGTRLYVEISDGVKGRQVIEIIDVLGMSELPPVTHAAPATGPEIEMSGTVKWFKPEKGFGFVMPDDKDKDVFVHKSIVQRAGLAHLEPGQQVKMRVQTSAKGREATWLQLI
jgi:CspA family cold shock protein